MEAFGNGIAAAGGAAPGNELEDCFADARHLAARMAGLNLLGALRKESFVPDHPLAAAISLDVEELAGRLGRARPRSGAARHAHFHLARALRLLRAAGRETTASMRLRRPGTQACELIAQALDELRATARIISGLELFDLGQGCCAAHRSPRQTKEGGAA